MSTPIYATLNNEGMPAPVKGLQPVAQINVAVAGRETTKELEALSTLTCETINQ